jgi:hypothetical protein
MMPTPNLLLIKLLEAIVDHLDIPESYYQRAVDRHRSLGEWLCRPESRVAVFQPHVSPQGSFRYGTVNRPLVAAAEYDLDNVTMLRMAKTAMTQRQIKELYGAEVKGYAKANGMLAPVEEKNRCWRLVYSDEASFHLDTLPCVPEERTVILAIASRGVPLELAERAIAITDRKHPQYELITEALFSSNPRGFARWFESRARAVAQIRLRQLVEKRLYASVEDVPPYEWKTPLQRVIQILKRHRDVMFQADPSVSPISMIITNLAAHAYAGEADLWSALSNIVEKMPQYVRPTRPRVPNPADPAEDYADRWAKNSQLESNFWAWHTQVRVDIASLQALLSSPRLRSEISTKFGVELTQDELARLQSREVSVGPALVVSAPSVRVSSAPRPWGYGG